MNIWSFKNISLSLISMMLSMSNALAQISEDLNLKKVSESTYELMELNLIGDAYIDFISKQMNDEFVLLKEEDKKNKTKCSIKFLQDKNYSLNFYKENAINALLNAKDILEINNIANTALTSKFYLQNSKIFILTFQTASKNEIEIEASKLKELVGSEDFSKNLEKLKINDVAFERAMSFPKLILSYAASKLVLNVIDKCK